MIEGLTIALMLSGASFMLIAGIGLFRLPDLFTRMHAAAKASSFGVGQILLAVALHYGTPWVIFECALVILFIYMTAPVASHMLGRTSYFLRIPMWGENPIDELKDHYDLNKHTLASDWNGNPREFSQPSPLEGEEKKKAPSQKD